MKKARAPIDFTKASMEELDNYGMGLLVWDTLELSAILKGHLLIERVIEALIAQKMLEPAKFLDKHRVSFDMKVDLASSLGLLAAPHVSAAKALNKIRNAYAHDEAYKVSLEELNSLKIEWEEIQDKAYEAACSKGIEEASRIAIIFLNWTFLRLLPRE